MIFQTRKRAIIGVAAGDDALVHHHLLVHPGGAGSFHVLADGLVGRCLTAFQRIGLHQQPGPVAHRGYRLAAVQESLHHFHGVFVGPQLVGIDHPARNDQRLVIALLHILYGQVHIRRDGPSRPFASL